MVSSYQPVWNAALTNWKRCRRTRQMLRKVVITGFIWDSATTELVVDQFLVRYPPQFPAQVVVSPSRGSRAGGSPWMTKRNKSPQTLHAFSSTVESNVRKCLVFSSYWLVLNTQILWHFWTDPSVAWIQANVQCATLPAPDYKTPVLMVSLSAEIVVWKRWFIN